jgi:hypothetical protein
MRCQVLAGSSPLRCTTVRATRWIDDASLMVSELFSNTVEHTDSDTVTVGVETTGDGRARCTVTDRAPGGVLQSRPVDLTTLGGNGLAIVDQLATGWGCYRDATTSVELSESAIGIPLFVDLDRDAEFRS